MKKFFILRILIFFCISFIGKATFYCNLNTDIVQSFDESEGAKLPYIKQAYLANEDFVFRPEILTQIEDMISREGAFRQRCGIAEGTNVAQLCVHLLYNNGDHDCV